MAWLMVLKAAERLIRMLSWPESEEKRRSLVTLRRALLGLCCVRNPYWNGLNRSLLVRWLMTRAQRRIYGFGDE